MRVDEVARALDVGHKRVYQLVAAGTIPHVRIGQRSIRVPRVAFTAWLEVQAEDAIDNLSPSAMSEPDG